MATGGAIKGLAGMNAFAKEVFFDLDLDSESDSPELSELLDEDPDDELEDPSSSEFELDSSELLELSELESVRLFM